MRKVIGGTVLVAAALMIGVVQAGFRLNFTDSAPHGVWIVHPVDFRMITARRGRIISVCPPAVPVVKWMGENGFLPYGTCQKTNVAPLLKAIGAVPGDVVTLKNGAPVLVNGEVLPNTESINPELAWPAGEYVVKPWQVWVFSTYSGSSFDSRYFGPVDAFSIRGEAFPVYVNGYHEDMRQGILP